MGLGRLLAVGPALAVLVWGQAALASLRTCLEVESSSDDATDLEWLVASEVNRHPTHQVVVADCQSYLRVEVLSVGEGDASERFVTARIDAEVPHRERVGADGLAAAIERALAVVLQSDSLTRSDTRPGDPFPQSVRELEQRGRNHAGVELFSVGAVVGGEIETFPGVAIMARREVSWLHVGARISAASCLPRCGRELHYSRQFAAQLDLSLYTSSTAPTAGFGSALFGIEYQRFYGRRHYDLVESYGAATAIGPSLGLRGGVELLRHADARFQFFAQPQLPLFVTNDRDHGVIKRWVPSLTLGVGAVL
jgi:hypothetical protein